VNPSGVVSAGTRIEHPHYVATGFVASASGRAAQESPRMSERNTARLTRDEVYDLLMNARQAEWVELSLEDGRSLSGAIIFNEFKGTGRLINVDEEFSYDFNVDQVTDVKI
jgi:hypothetical protein